MHNLTSVFFSHSSVRDCPDSYVHKAEYNVIKILSTKMIITLLLYFSKIAPKSHWVEFCVFQIFSVTYL